MRRRSVDSMELQHMKAQAKEERERKQVEIITSINYSNIA